MLYVPGDGESFASISERFLGSASEAWQLAESNPDLPAPVGGKPLAVPVVPRNPLGVTANGVQAVPILCYHRMATGSSKMAVAPTNFAMHMQWLVDNGYRVISLDALADFLAGRRPLPQRSVVLTFDDGYESVYRHAFPVLKQHNMPATLFVYTDFMGSPDAISWPQLEDMVKSKLVDVQAHSKTHRRLTERLPGEDEAMLRQQVDVELKQPRSVIERRLGALGVKVKHFAYPYGDANEPVLQAMQRLQYEIGVTVVPGNNPFYSSPLLLKRVMIYGEHSLEDFQARLNGKRLAN